MEEEQGGGDKPLKKLPATKRVVVMTTQKITEFITRIEDKTAPRADNLSVAPACNDITDDRRFYIFGGEVGITDKRGEDTGKMMNDDLNVKLGMIRDENDEDQRPETTRMTT